MLNRPAVAVTDVKLLHEITLHNTYDYNKPPMSGLRPLIGDGIITAEGEKHKRQRKMMNPAFAHNNIKVITVYLVSGKKHNSSC